MSIFLTIPRITVNTMQDVTFRRRQIPIILLLHLQGSTIAFSEIRSGNLMNMCISQQMQEVINTKQNQQAMKQKEHEKKKRHRERALKLQRLLYLSNLDDREIDPISEEEREALRVELWRGEQSHLRIVEVFYKGEVIFTGTRKDVCRKCKKANRTMIDLLRYGHEDKQGRTYRYKDWSGTIDDGVDYD